MVEYCTLEEGIKVGKNCIISNLHLPVSVIDHISHASCNSVGDNSVHCAHYNGAKLEVTDLIQGI